MPNWGRAKKTFQGIVSKNGIQLEWLLRVVSGSSAYDTDSTVTYGYGDDTRYWTTGSFNAIIEPVREQDIVIEPGFFQEDYLKIYFDPDETPAYFDQVINPSGSGIRYLVLPVEDWTLTTGNVTVCKTAIIRRLVPRSGSQY